MRILYIHQYFVPARQSGGTRSLEMGRRLVADGHDVELISADRSGGTPPGRWRVSDEEGIRVHWVGVPYDNNMGKLARLRAFATFAGLASVRAAQIPCDVVFATSTPLTVAIPGLAASRGQRVPMVFEVRDLWPDVPIALGALRRPATRALARGLERLAYRGSSRIVALSPGMRDGVLRAGVPAEQVEVIPNACDIELFAGRRGDGEALRARLDWLGDRPLVVYAGTLGFANDVRWLARLAARVRPIAPEVRFLVVGDGAERRAIAREADTLGVLGESFHMLPPRSKTEVAGVLAAADVCTSLFRDSAGLEHNSANKFFDALAAGRPVAINYGGWQADLLRDHGAGIVLGRDGLDAAARDLMALLGDRESLARAGQAASELARTQFARDELAARLQQVLLSAAHEGALSRGARPDPLTEPASSWR